MDRKLRSELNAIARDRTSGAGELALQATAALRAWLRRNPGKSAHELVEIAGLLLHVQPDMAPIWGLANEVARAADASKPGEGLRQALSAYGRRLAAAPKQIARRFRRMLARRVSKWRIVTYSYSSTVERALLQARRHIWKVTCSESRPGCEGRKIAGRLARAGIWVQFVTDAELFSRVLDWDHVVVGADAVLSDGFVNKIGTDTLVERAKHIGAPVWVLADTTKFWPGDFLFRFRPHLKPRPILKIWKNAPKGVDAWNASMFEHTWFDVHEKFLTERGWMTPARVRREIRKIKISPRLRELAK